MAMTDIKPDIAAAVAFCLSLPQINLTAIHPTLTETVQYGEGRPFESAIIRGHSFAHDQSAEIEEWVTLSQSKGFGLYFNCNGLNRPLDKFHKKARESDVNALHMLHLDLDDPKQVTDKRKFKSAHKATLDRLLAVPLIPEPSLIVDSGNGYGAFWTIYPALKVTDGNRLYLKSRNKAIRELFAADPCENLDRIMRLPGSVNFPNAAKEKRGRVPALAHVILDKRSCPLSEYRLKDFPMSREMPAATSFSGSAYHVVGEPEIGDAQALVRTKAFWALDTDMKARILTEEIPVGERSGAVFAVCCELRRRGWSDGEIIAIVIEPGFAISGHILDQKQREPHEQASRMIVSMNDKGIVPYAREFDDDETPEI
jgi:hypothetical protein